MDDASTRMLLGGHLIADYVIRKIGSNEQLPDGAYMVIAMRGMLIMPGLVNVHHHDFQTRTRNILTAQNANLFDELAVYYPIWAGPTSEGNRGQHESRDG